MYNLISLLYVQQNEAKLDTCWVFKLLNVALLMLKIIVPDFFDGGEEI